MPERPAVWQTLSESVPEDYIVMKLQHVLRKHAVDGREGRFVLAHAPHWVNIIPVTKQGKIVLVEQFRHGMNTLSLEIPGGITEANEDYRTAAERECREETGYSSPHPSELLGIIEPNPAFMTNECSVYLWKDVERTDIQALDPNEEIVVHELPLQNVLEKIVNGGIRHALVVSALNLYMLNYPKVFSNVLGA